MGLKRDLFYMGTFPHTLYGTLIICASLCDLETDVCLPALAKDRRTLTDFPVYLINPNNANKILKYYRKQHTFDFFP